MIPVTLNIFDVSGTLLDTIDPSSTAVDSVYLSSADSTTCRNAVVGVAAQFTYASNATGTIVAAVLNATVSDVALDQFAALTFAAGFAAENKIVPSNIIAGTPGYSPGYKVRAGTLVSEAGKTAILERESGFAVPGGGRACDVVQWKRVSFLYSVVSSGCLVSMTEADLQSVCTSGTGTVISNLINQTVDGVGTAFDRIARTNDAFTNDTTSWVEIQGLSSALSLTTGTYNEYTRTCQSTVIGLHYQFVIARAGAEYNAQDIIVAAFVSPIFGTLRIRNETSFDTDASSPQQFTFKVSFSRYNPDSQATIRRRVVAPPILPRLDDTIFYPFRSPYPL